MKRDTKIWQNEGALVFKLVETGGYDLEKGNWVPSLQNEWTLRVNRSPVKGETPAANAYKEVFMAEYLVKVLNASNFQESTGVELGSELTVMKAESSGKSAFAALAFSFKDIRKEAYHLANSESELNPEQFVQTVEEKIAELAFLAGVNFSKK